MYDMLRALDSLSPQQRNNFWDQHTNITIPINMNRISYAVAVVMTQALPINAPGDLNSTGQVQVATDFLREKSLRTNIVQIAIQEWKRWGRGTIDERDTRMVRTLQDYWKTGTGITVTPAQLANAKFQEDNAWSGTFISWVLRKAGAANLFHYSGSHSFYVVWAKNNRITNNDSFFKAYRITEVKPQLGDLVCMSRNHSGATYDSIVNGMKTHSDIVTGIGPGYITVIGGNVGGSVSKRRLATNRNGIVTEPDYFAVIRLSAPYNR